MWPKRDGDRNINPAEASLKRDTVGGSNGSFGPRRTMTSYGANSTSGVTNTEVPQGGGTANTGTAWAPSPVHHGEQQFREIRPGSVATEALIRANCCKSLEGRASGVPGPGERGDERVQVSGVDDHFIVLGRGVEASEEVVEGFGGDCEGVCIVALVPVGEAP